MLSTAGHVWADPPGLGLRASVHEFGSLHYARVPQAQVWGSEDQSLSFLPHAAPLCNVQDISKLHSKLPSVTSDISSL